MRSHATPPANLFRLVITHFRFMRLMARELVGDQETPGFSQKSLKAIQKN